LTSTGNDGLTPDKSLPADGRMDEHSRSQVHGLRMHFLCLLCVGPTEAGNEIVANFRARHSGEIATSVAIAARLSLYDRISSGGPAFGLGQAEMSIPSMLDRPRQPDWNGL
jgi:hypothetical protein